MVLYRRSEEEMPAYEYEYEIAKKDGCVYYFLTAPKRIVGKGRWKALMRSDETGKPDASGWPVPEAFPGVSSSWNAIW